MSDCILSKVLVKVLGLVLILIVSGCPITMPLKKIEIVTPEIILKKFNADAKKRYQISGTFVANATGIKRLFGSVNLDIVAQAPTSLYLSVRSFFNQPARVIATNGIMVHCLETSSAGTPNYFKHAVDGKEIAELIPLPLTVNEVVEVMLGIVDTKKLTVTNIEMDYRGENYLVTLRNQKKNITELTVRIVDNVILNRRQKDANNNEIYSVAYDDFHSVKGIDWAHRWNFTVKLKNKSYGVTIKGESIDFNGKLFDEDTFYIEPI